MKNGVETIADSDGILWLNEKHIEEGLSQKNFQMTTVKYLSDHRKRRYELIDEPKNNPTQFLYAKNQQPKLLRIIEDSSI